MKKTILISVLIIFVSNAFSQHFIPIKLMFANEYSAALYGGISLDKGNGQEFLQSMSNTGQTGFVVNALYKKKGGLNGAREVFHQFLIDFNPAIVDWDAFENNLIKQSVTDFSVNKMPFSEDAFLHIGWHRNSLGRFDRGGKDQLQHLRLFGEMYYRPYNVVKTTSTIEENYKFSVFNLNFGTQYSYIKKNVPSLGTFLIGASLQMNFMLTNESDTYLSSLENLVGAENYKGKNYMGPGGKITVQINYLNIYVEGRQYYSIDDKYLGEKFTKEPIFLVGAFTNLNWTKKKKTSENGVTPPVKLE